MNARNTTRSLYRYQKIYPCIALLIIVSVWEFLCKEGMIEFFVLPSPTDILRSLFDDRSELFYGLMETSYTSMMGFFISFLLSLFLSSLFVLNPILLQAFFPITTVLQTLPLVAIAPLLVIWFGYGLPTVIAASTIVCFFSILASTIQGLVSENSHLRDLFFIYGANRFQTFVKLKLPSSIPFIVHGLRIGSGLSVIGSIVGEFIGGTGLGSVIDMARSQQRLDKVFASVFLASCLGFLMLSCVNWVGNFLIKKWSQQY